MFHHTHRREVGVRCKLFDRHVVLCLRAALSFTPKQDDAAVNEAAALVRSRLVGGLRASTDRVASAVLERVSAVFEERLPWLKPLWEKVKSLPPTTDLISFCWKGYVEALDGLKHRKADTKTATSFTLTRFAGWGERLEAWVNHESVLEAGNAVAREEQGLHYLCCIINFVEEVSVYGSSR